MLELIDPAIFDMAWGKGDVDQAHGRGAQRNRAPTWPGTTPDGRPEVRRKSAGKYGDGELLLARR
jgi:hypothetical protein